MTLKERIAARNNRVVFVNIETGEFSLEARDGFDEFLFRRIEIEQLGMATAALYAKTVEQKDQLVLSAVAQNKVTMEQYRAYRENEGRPLRDDEPLPVFDSAKFNDFARKIFLEKSLITPTLEELGGYEALVDVAHILVKAYEFLFDAVLPKATVGEALETPETAETFPSSDGKRTRQPSKKVRAKPSVVAAPIPKKPLRVQRQ